MSSVPVFSSEPGDPTLRSVVPWLGDSSSDSSSSDDDLVLLYSLCSFGCRLQRDFLTASVELSDVLEPAVEGLIIVLFMEALLLEGLCDGTGLAAASHSLSSSAAAIILSIATFAL
ncbi:hypothetical protein J6590_079141 [Homalodisca vitripennis]|nr:hypothetical protein J6590_079141 [Homalodisca vitripennis]